MSLDSEKRRLDEEVENIKLTHHDQVNEIKNSQSNELDMLRESHEKTLHTGRQKLIQEKAKLEMS